MTVTGSVRRVDNHNSEIITADTFENQMETMLKEMNGLVYAMIIIGAVICIASIYVSVNMLVSENANNISMLKVLGKH